MCLLVGRCVFLLLLFLFLLLLLGQLGACRAAGGVVDKGTGVARAIAVVGTCVGGWVDDLSRWIGRRVGGS